MQIERILQVIDTIRSEDSVCNWTIRGIPFWPLFRLKLLFNLQSQDVHAPIGQRGVKRIWANGRKLISRRGENKRDFLADRKNSHLVPAQAQVLLSTWNDGRVHLQNGFFANFYMGGLADSLTEQGYSTLLMEQFISEVSNRNPKSHPTFLYSKPLDLSLLNLRVRKLIRTSSVDLPVETQRQIKKLDAEFGLSPRIFTQIIHDIDLLLIMKEHFKRTLISIKPKLVLVTCWYTLEQMALGMACNELGITWGDYQHGVISPMSLEYASWDEMKDESSSLLPHWFFTWSKSGADVISKWAGNNGPHRAINIGNAWIDLWNRKNVADPELLSWSSSLRAGGKLVILYTLQNMIPPKWIFDEVNRTQGSISWVFRPHPARPDLAEVIKKRLPGQFSEHMVTSTRFPMLGLLQMVDGHVTSHSCTVVEAAEVGKKSVLVTELGRSMFPDQIKFQMSKYHDGQKPFDWRDFFSATTSYSPQLGMNWEPLVSHIPTGRT